MSRFTLLKITQILIKNSQSSESPVSFNLKIRSHFLGDACMYAYGPKMAVTISDLSKLSTGLLYNYNVIQGPEEFYVMSRVR